MSTSAGFCWTFPGSPIRIELDLGVVERLKREILHSGTMETGGVLLGNTVPDSVPTVRITDFRPVGHMGTHYVLTVAERSAFAQTVADLRRAEPATAVGYYRSQLREGLALDQEDLALIRTCRFKANDVFLVMRPNPHGEITSGFFFWDDGYVNAAFSFLEFPLDAGELREEPAKAKRVALNDRPRNAARLIWGALTLALLVTAGLLLRYRTEPGTAPSVTAAPDPAAVAEAPVPAREAAPAPAPGTGFEYETGARNIRITWNKTAPAVTSAKAGLLSIRDGETERSISLVPHQLRAGSFNYTPRSQTVWFRLEFFSGDGTAVRENRLVTVPTQLPGEAARSAVTASAARAETASAAEPTVRRPEPQVARPFEPPRRASALNGGPAAAIEPPALSVTAPTASPLRSFAPPAVPKDAPPPPRATDFRPKPPGIQQREEYIPPKPIRQVQPVLPPGLRSMVPRRMQVAVKLNIDESGKITAAEPVTAGQGPGILLGTIAANAARRWRFEPARRNSRAVPAELVVVFDFEPVTQK